MLVVTTEGVTISRRYILTEMSICSLTEWGMYSLVNHYYITPPTMQLTRSELRTNIRARRSGRIGIDFNRNGSLSYVQTLQMIQRQVWNFRVNKIVLRFLPFELKLYCHGMYLTLTN